MQYFRSHILIGIDETSLKAGVKQFKQALLQEIAKQDLSEEIGVLETATLGFFNKGICLVVYPDNATYVDFKIEDIPRFVEEHLLKGRALKEYISDDVRTKKYDFEYNKRIVLENSGKIDPENIEEYIGVGGYEAWEKALLEMDSTSIVNEVKESGLRGRGGAGFPTGLKWSFTAPIKTDQKYVVINADEGEPGTFKDRLIMEGDPHKLIEGIAIAAYAIGATKSFIYIRGEYKLSIERLQKAIDSANEYGLLGKNIFESGFDLEISIKIGAGAYVCGEETALIESLEGNRGIPRLKPPFPGVKGVWQKPTVVNNVETIANIPSIIKNGASWYKGFGTEQSKGTKVYTILGDVKTPGLTEVPMGVTLSEIINKNGGGIADDKKFKAALIGGAAGVILSSNLINVKMAYETLSEYKAVLGSGAILVMNEDVDMVEMLFSIIRFFRHESCGKCTPCRVGNAELYKLIIKFKKYEATIEDLEKMISVATVMNKTSFCALGQSPLMPIKSAITNFREDFLKRIKK